MADCADKRFGRCDVTAHGVRSHHEKRLLRVIIHSPMEQVVGRSRSASPHRVNRECYCWDRNPKANARQKIEVKSSQEDAGGSQKEHTDANRNLHLPTKVCVHSEISRSGLTVYSTDPAVSTIEIRGTCQCAISA